MRNIISVTRVFLSRVLSRISPSRRKKPAYSPSEDLRHPAPTEKQIDNLAIVREAAAKRLKKQPHKLSDSDYKKVTGLMLLCPMISDLTPLKQLENLQKILLSGMPVPNLSPLKYLTKLEQFSLWDAQVPDLAPLKDLTKLQSLTLNGTKVSDLTPLKDLKNLLRLYLKYTPVSDLTPLKNLKNLLLLQLVDTKVSYQQIAVLKMALPKLVIAN